MAAATLRLYESPEEQSFVELKYDDLTLLASGIRVVSGAGRPLQLSVTYLGISSTRIYAPGSDVTWAFAVPPAITVAGGKLTFNALTAWGIQHGALTPSGNLIPPSL